MRENLIELRRELRLHEGDRRLRLSARKLWHCSKLEWLLCGRLDEIIFGRPPCVSGSLEEVVLHNIPQALKSGTMLPPNVLLVDLQPLDVVMKPGVRAAATSTVEVALMERARRDTGDLYCTAHARSMRIADST